MEYERRDTIVLSGQTVPVVSKGENCRTIFCNLFRQHLSMKIDANEIFTAHRIGRQHTGTSDQNNHTKYHFFYLRKIDNRNKWKNHVIVTRVKLSIE